jgi:hypothetical protein
MGFMFQCLSRRLFCNRTGASLHRLTVFEAAAQGSLQRIHPDAQNLSLSRFPADSLIRWIAQASQLWAVA